MKRMKSLFMEFLLFQLRNFISMEIKTNLARKRFSDNDKKNRKLNKYIFLINLN